LKNKKEKEAEKGGKRERNSSIWPTHSRRMSDREQTQI
jgi:hypothetical protein